MKIDTNTNNTNIITLNYSIRSPWDWVINAALSKKSNLIQLKRILGYSIEDTILVQQNDKRKLPSFLHNIDTNYKAPCTLRLEIIVSSNSNNNNNNLNLIHGTSSIMNEMEDKDEFLQTIINQKCEYLIPDSILIPWDVSRDCLEMLIKNKFIKQKKDDEKGKEKDISNNNGNENNDEIVILKTPLGSRGDGIYFFKIGNQSNMITNTTAIDAMYDVIKKNYNNALSEKGFLQYIQQSKKRIPSWVLQKEIYPPYLLSINDKKKFHFRSYLLLLEGEEEHEKVPSKNMLFIYNRHEIRVASVKYDRSNIPFYNSNNNGDDHNRLGHITNGACSDTTERKLLHTIQELNNKQIQDKLELFLAKAFAKDLHGIINNNNTNNHHRQSSSYKTKITKFAICGIDIMMDTNERFYILEMNMNPAAPPQDCIDDIFREHLIGLMNDLIMFLIVNSSSNEGDEKVCHSSSSTSNNDIYNFVNIQSVLDSND